MRSIGGVLDYRLLAQLHRPDDEGLRREAIRLTAQGLSPADIAVALRLHVEQVRGWLSAREGAPA